MQQLTKICKYCKAVIAKDAHFFPACEQKPKEENIYYKRILIGLLLIFELLAGISFPSVKIAEAAERSEKTEIRVGETYEGKRLKITYIASGKYVSDSMFAQPEAGYEYIYLKFTAENVSDSDASINSYSFDCYADGYKADTSIFVGDDQLSATLSAGRSAIGSVYFEVPVNASEIEVEYEPSFFSSEKIIFIYEGEKDSGITVAGDTTAAEDAHHVGDVFEAGDFRFTYLSAYADNTSSFFMQPEDGYHYVTCEFEVENIGDSDKSISTFSFDCFADGIECESAWLLRDDGIDATISSGRKARGTVSFEVPISAKLVEVEYETSFWTSNRIVFDASGAQ